MIEDSLYSLLSYYKKFPDPLKRLIYLPFSFIPRKYLLGTTYENSQNKIYEFEYSSHSEIEEYQFRTMKNLLNHAYNTVPFYRDKWNEQGIKINDIQNFNDFRKLIPYTTRQDLQDHSYEFISSNYDKKHVLRTNTGGSTGIPLTLYYLKGYSRALEHAHMHVLWSRVGYVWGERIARLRGDFIGKDRVYTFDPWRNTLILSSYEINISNTNMYFDLLRKYKVNYIHAYPASLFNLIQLSKKKSIVLPELKAIFLGSENMFDFQLEKFKSFFQTPNIYYWYGHGEQCALGGICEKSTDYHFLPTYSYVELEDSVKINPESDIHEIVGTSFVNPLMPIIRYRTMDYASKSLSKNCECGRNHFRLKTIYGREQEMAVGFDNQLITLTALVFGRHKEYFHHIRNMQVVNTRPGYLVIRIVPLLTFNNKFHDEIVNSFSMKEGMPFEAKVELVDNIQTTKNGKSKFLIK